MRPRAESGFTLIEVLVALGVFVAVALSLDSIMGADIGGVMRYEDKTLATWVASNKLVELQVYQRWPANGRSDDEAESGGRKWFVETTVADGPYPETRRVDIAVGPKPEKFGEQKHPVATLTGLLAKPAGPFGANAGGGAGEGGGERNDGKGAGK